jgi:hydrogenase expression/formation protein HypC
MCLGVPGQITQIQPDPTGMTMGKVSFGGVQREVCLAYVPEAEVGNWVLVHVGFALNVLDEEEAQQIFDALALMEPVDVEAPFAQRRQPGPGEEPPQAGAPEA